MGLQALILPFLVGCVFADQYSEQIFKQSDVDGYVMEEEVTADSMLTCAAQCSKMKTCDGVSYDYPNCEMITSDITDTTPSAAEFHKIYQIFYTNLPRRTEDGFILIRLKWPITSNGYILIKGHIMSLYGPYSNPHIMLNKGGFPDESSRHDFGLKIDEPGKCRFINFHEGHFVPNPFDCDGLKAGTAFTLKMEFPDEVTCVMSINGIVTNNTLARSFDFETLRIGLSYEVDSVTIEF